MWSAWPRGIWSVTGAASVVRCVLSRSCNRTCRQLNLLVDQDVLLMPMADEHTFSCTTTITRHNPVSPPAYHCAELVARRLPISGWIRARSSWLLRG